MDFPQKHMEMAEYFELEGGGGKFKIFPSNIMLQYVYKCDRSDGVADICYEP